MTIRRRGEALPAVLTITGPMRSGTSRVARIAHQLGISMGTQMRLPPPGTALDPEYEDQPLADALATFALRGVLDEALLEGYRRVRQEEAKGSRWGFKSPLLLLCWSAWIRSVAQGSSEPPVVILCTREAPSCRESLVRASRSETELRALLGIQARILQALAEREGAGDLRIPFGMSPREIAAQIAHRMEIPDPDLDLAILGVRAE